MCEQEVASERTRADTASRTREEEVTKLNETQQQLREATARLKSVTEQLESDLEAAENLREELHQSKARGTART